jgi:hypothetical protein
MFSLSCAIGSLILFYHQIWVTRKRSIIAFVIALALASIAIITSPVINNTLSLLNVSYVSVEREHDRTEFNFVIGNERFILDVPTKVSDWFDNQITLPADASMVDSVENRVPLARPKHVENSN